MNELVVLQSFETPSLVTAAGYNARTRFTEFFVNTIRNAHTRRAYTRNVGEFLAWCEDYGVASIAEVQPLHVGTYIELLTRDPLLSAPTIKQKLASIRMLFDWLVTGQVMGVNPAASVRGPSHIVKRGKTPVLDLIEARALIDAIDVSMPIGLRDRALIGLMVYSFARIGDALIVLIDHLPREALTPSEAKAIHELKVMLKEIQKIKLGHNRPAFGPKKD